MSGHSKWATIKHKKGALDAKRGKIFTRLIKEISIAAKNGGDPDTNPRLRGAILAAKAENMPADNIKRAILRGTGELPGATYEEFSLEGYGPGGVAVLLDINTDNRNRTVSEIRHAFGKNGGNMAEAGAVSWMFHKKGDIVIPKTAAKEDDLMGIVLEAGAEDLRDDGDNWEVLSEPAVYEAVLEAVKKAGIEPVLIQRVDDSAKLHQAGGSGREPDDPPDGSARRARRRAERPLQFRYRPETSGRSSGVGPQTSDFRLRPTVQRRPSFALSALTCRIGALDFFNTAVENSVGKRESTLLSCLLREPSAPCTFGVLKLLVAPGRSSGVWF